MVGGVGPGAASARAPVHNLLLLLLLLPWWCSEAGSGEVARRRR